MYKYLKERTAKKLIVENDLKVSKKALEALDSKVEGLLLMTIRIKLKKNNIPKNKIIPEDIPLFEVTDDWLKQNKLLD